MTGIAPSTSRLVLTYGVFDPFSPDHALFLQQARRLGTGLVVGCATDEYCARRGTTIVQRFETRRAILERCRHVSRVIARARLDQHHTDIVNYDIAVLALPEQWQGLFDHLKHLAQVVYLPARHTVPSERPGMTALPWAHAG